jgi:hypothetical protein
MMHGSRGNLLATSMGERAIEESRVFAMRIWERLTADKMLQKCYKYLVFPVVSKAIGFQAAYQVV